MKLQLQGRRNWRNKGSKRKERRKWKGGGRKEGRTGIREGEKEGKNNVTGDELFKHCLIWRLQNSRREAVTPCFSDLNNTLFSPRWETGFSRPNFLQVCRSLSLRITKFVKIPLPPGLLHHDNRHCPPRPAPPLQEPIACVSPGKKGTDKAICCHPVHFPCEQQPRSRTSAEGLWGFAPAGPMLQVHLPRQLQSWAAPACSLFRGCHQQLALSMSCCPFPLFVSGSSVLTHGGLKNRPGQQPQYQKVQRVDRSWPLSAVPHCVLGSLVARNSVPTPFQSWLRNFCTEKKTIACHSLGTL